MQNTGEITSLHIDTELRTCTACGYERGFHVSFLSAGAGKDAPVRSTRDVFRVILICPECGARYDAGVQISFGETGNRFVNAADRSPACIPHGSVAACLPLPPRHDRNPPE